MVGHRHHGPDPGVRRLAWAVAVNVLLTAAQVIGGVLSGSLALVADALHNLSDAAGLLLALIARRISQRPPDEKRTFGYGMAEVVGGLVNLTSIIVIAAFLLVEALSRTFERPEVDGWTVIALGGLALVVDLATAAFTYSMSKESLNIKAAFLHNVSDALASVAVVASGTLVILFDWYWTDLVATVGISIYIVWLSWPPLRKCVRLLMASVPEELSVAVISDAIKNMDGVLNVANVYVWSLDERTSAIQARVEIRHEASMNEAAALRDSLGELLERKFGIGHASIEVIPIQSLATAPQGER